MLIRIALAVFCLGLAAPASAQIYTWRDVHGNLVLSNTRPGASRPDVRSYAVPQTQNVRATRYVAGDRGRAYDDLIGEHCRTQGIRPDLVKAVMQVESAFNPRARSPKGALGLMQLMPAIVQQYNVRDAFDPAENVRGGVAYLRSLLDRYNNNEQLALAAYNAGPGAVDKYGQNVPPYRETRNYVKQITNMTIQPLQTRGKAIYKVTEIVNGEERVSYTDKKPTAGFVQVSGTR